MSKNARRKNRRSGAKKGFRREAGPTPRPKIRELREAATAADGHKPAALGGSGSETGPQPARSRSAGRLLRLAQDWGLREADLDELVYDMVHSGASSSYNNGAHPELGDIEAFDAVHDEADETASRINSQGLAAQIEALVTAFGEVGAEQLVRDAAQE